MTFNTFDATVGFARIRGRWRKCVCIADELVGCSERELQLLTAELREHYRLQYGKEQVEITQKQLADFRRKNTAKEAILRQQRNDREARAALAVLEGGRGKRTVVSVSHDSPASGTEQRTLKRNPERGQSTPSSRHPVGDGDTLRVLRRLR